MGAPDKVVPLPELVTTPNVNVRTQLERGVVVHVAEVDGGSSSRDLALRMLRARHDLRDVPEVIRHVEVRLAPVALDQIHRAEDKRRRRAERLAQLEQAAAARAATRGQP